MFYKSLVIHFLSFIFAVTSLSASSYWRDPAPILHYLEGVAVFEGDRHGDFKNDFVAILTDGSAWKVHPKDRDNFAQWNANDIVHIAVRDTFYWFKREHKFELHNHTNNQTVRVMLLQYPREYFMIVQAEAYIADTHLHFYTTTDSNGNTHTHYYQVNDYEKQLVLNDGSIWIIKNKFGDFTFGNKVYVGVNDTNKGLYYSLISGTQREAVWTWARRVN